MTRIFITGAQGFIGSHLVHRLKARGLEVAGPEIQLADVAGLAAALTESKPDWIIHLAGISSVPACAKDPGLAYTVNAAGTANLLEAAITAKLPSSRVLFASTAQVYRAPGSTELGADAAPWNESRAVEPQNTYARTKLAGEAVIRGFGQAYGTKSTIFRIFNHTHFSQAPDFILPHLYQQLKAAKDTGKRRVTIPVGNLDLDRDIGGIHDLLGAFEAVVMRPMASLPEQELFNVASGSAKRLRTLAEALARTMGIEAEFVVDPSRIRAGEPKRICGSSEKLQKATGWKPTCVDVDSLLKSFLAPVT